MVRAHPLLFVLVMHSALVSCHAEVRAPSEPRPRSAPPLPTKSTAAHSADVPAVAEPPLPNLPADEIRAPLEHVWHLKEVRYHDGRPPFSPKGYGGPTFHEAGNVGWRDGCNRIGGKYEASGQSLTIRVNSATRLGCPFEPEDVNYEQVTHYTVDGRRLELHTPTQTYILTRAPYSLISEHDWYLYSIVDLQEGASLHVDRVRKDYRHLQLSVDSDRSFQFIDYDDDKVTGSIRVKSDGGVRLALDKRSQQRVSSKPRRLERVPDSTNRNVFTQELYPLTYADIIEWSKVRAYRIFRAEVLSHGSTEKLEEKRVLELYTHRQVYRFIQH